MGSVPWPPIKKGSITFNRIRTDIAYILSKQYSADHVYYFISGVQLHVCDMISNLEINVALRASSSSDQVHLVTNGMTPLFNSITTRPILDQFKTFKCVYSIGFLLSLPTQLCCSCVNIRFSKSFGFKHSDLSLFLTLFFFLSFFPPNSNVT